ncbi:Hypothetical predicted protein [Paramuricea clavata]|uniref:Uncharacterized protein n=2 Tax=Paramuricea clavata TaxID=317549 RepID=A0A7D9I1Z3_PARCT|nr:Hypothetical predicted protein [Paramuricea clavata]
MDKLDVLVVVKMVVHVYTRTGACVKQVGEALDVVVILTNAKRARADVVTNEDVEIWQVATDAHVAQAINCSRINAHVKVFAQRDFFFID